ncbi:molybdenum cofactor biosynthesis protein MoeB [Candidatus Woesearchaeota archaeon]|jgi:adenylyltransferase/sulfurtransferase|nr:molybdenum cofactor biosynthesis protein MoeB [Candidatus Woesearchaeota archaeon]
MINNKLTKQELSRYSRHLVLPEVRIKGQEKIKQSKVLIVGAGGLGSPVALYLAAAGIGTIGIVDFDKVEENNLQRQIIHSTKDLGTKKTESAKNSINNLNPNVKVNLHNVKLDSKNALEIIKKYDVVIDGSDNFPTRYLVNDACVLLNKPDVYGSIFKFEGHVSVFNFDNGPCYRCLFPNPPPKGTIPNCAEAGVLGVLPGIIGTIQATEALKIILSKGEVLSGRFLVYDALNIAFRELKLGKNKNCPICGESPRIKELIDYEQFCQMKEEEEKSLEEDEINVQQMKKMIDNHEDFLLIDVREEPEWDICKIKGAKLIPLSQIMNRNIDILEDIEKDKNIVLYCHTGARSSEALQILRDEGFKNLKNLVGGIDAWANEIDQEVTIY